MKNKLHIVHVIHKLAMGGLENGLVNLVNGLPTEGYQHTIVSLTTQESFAERIKKPNVRVLELHKKAGPLAASFFKLYSLFKQLKADVLHTRNFSTLECQFPGFLARIPTRIHSEHGRDSDDLEGKDKKKIILRKSFNPIVHQYVALSKDLETYLQQTIGIPSHKIKQIYNGVDLKTFHPASTQETDDFIILSAGRLTPVKDIPTLFRGFALFSRVQPKAQLWIVGDGPLSSELEALSQSLGISRAVTFWGQRADLPQLMQKAQVYAQTSLFEGISNTLLEAMACGLPIIATRVGGNPELMVPNEQGFMVDVQNPDQVCQALQRLMDKNLRQQMAVQSRKRVEMGFDVNRMIKQYDELYAMCRGEVCVV